MKKIKSYIICGTVSSPRKLLVNGYVLEDGVFIHTNPDNKKQWCVTDIESGLLICKVANKEKCIEKYKELKPKVEEIRNSKYYQTYKERLINTKEVM